MKLIDKDALVAEIERRNKEIDEIGTYLSPKGILTNLLCYINSLEVKELDLEREQRMKECPYRKVGCTMYEDKILECDGACCWVVDYPKLKELKAQKGE